MLTCRMFAGQSCRSGTFRIARGTATLGCAPFPQPLLGASRLLPLASSLHPLAPHIAPLNPAHKSFLLRTYEKTPCNYSGMNTYETKDLKFSRMNTYRKTGGVGGGAVALLAALCRSFALCKDITYLRSCSCALFWKKYRGWGLCVLFLSWPRHMLPIAKFSILGDASRRRLV